ncbi:MAG: MerR family transcriptional regulator [Anaerolineae bacterium]|nr:MerR family transcriptional regulator [Anaerolineae bacterium]
MTDTLAQPLTIREVAERTDLSMHTLRYYERIGLIQSIDRAPSGHRRYSEDDIGWIEFLKKLRSTGMPIREMKRYANLLWQGDHTVGERRALLETHRKRMQAQIDELNDCLSCIEWKIKHYKEFETMFFADYEQETVASPTA